MQHLRPSSFSAFDRCKSAGSYKRPVDSTATPVGTGENLYTVWDFRNYLEMGALDLVLPGVRHAGILQTKKIASLAEAFHLQVAPLYLDAIDSSSNQFYDSSTKALVRTAAAHDPAPPCSHTLHVLALPDM